MEAVEVARERLLDAGGVVWEVNLLIVAGDAFEWTVLADLLDDLGVDFLHAIVRMRLTVSQNHFLRHGGHQAPVEAGHDRAGRGDECSFDELRGLNGLEVADAATSIWFDAEPEHEADLEDDCALGLRDEDVGCGLESVRIAAFATHGVDVDEAEAVRNGLYGACEDSFHVVTLIIM